MFKVSANRVVVVQLLNIRQSINSPHSQEWCKCDVLLLKCTRLGRHIRPMMAIILVVKPLAITLEFRRYAPRLQIRVDLPVVGIKDRLRWLARTVWFPDHIRRVHNLSIQSESRTIFAERKQYGFQTTFNERRRYSLDSRHLPCADYGDLITKIE